MKSKNNTVVSFINRKGGVGKTTSCVNLGAKLALEGKKVLLIDLDSQADMTSFFYDPFDLEDKNTILDVIENRCNLDDIIIERSKNLFVAPSEENLVAVNFPDEITAFYILDNAIKSLNNDFDYILIDCPGALEKLTTNAMITSNHIIIPIQTEYLSVRGFRKIKNNIDKFKNHCKELKNIFVLFTMYDKRKTASLATTKTIEKEDVNIFKTIINTNAPLSNAPALKQTIFEFDPNCKGAVDYANLGVEFLKKIK